MISVTTTSPISSFALSKSLFANAPATSPTSSIVLSICLSGLALSSPLSIDHFSIDQINSSITHNPSRLFLRILPHQTHTAFLFVLQSALLLSLHVSYRLPNLIE